MGGSFCEHVSWLLSGGLLCENMGPGGQWVHATVVSRAQTFVLEGSFVPRVTCQPHRKHADRHFLGVWRCHPSDMLQFGSPTSVNGHIAGQYLMTTFSSIFLMNNLTEAQQNLGGQFNRANLCLCFFSFQIIHNPGLLINIVMIWTKRITCFYLVAHF